MHPYAPWIITALVSIATAGWTQVWLCIRRDRREKQQHQWEHSTHTDWDHVVARINAEQQP